MRRALKLAAALAATSAPSLAMAQNIHTYPQAQAATPYAAAGAPTTLCWPEGAMVIDTNNDVFVQTSTSTCPGTWASLGGSGVAGITAAGTTSNEWTTNTDGALGTAEDATLWLKAGDGAVLHTLSLLMDTSADLAIFDYAAGGGTWSFLQAVSVTGGLTVATGDIVLTGVGALVDGVDLGALATSFAAFTTTTAATLTLNSDAVAGTPETVAIVMKSATGVVVPNVTIEANSSGGVYLYANPAGLDVSPTVVIGQSDDYQGTGADVDAALYWSGHQAGDAVGTKTTAYIALDSSSETFVVTPPTGGSTSINGGNLALTTGSITLAPAATVDGLDPSALALTTTGNGASLVGVEDAAGQFTTDNVEAALTQSIDAAQAAQSTADAAIPKATLAAGNTLLVGTAASTPDDLIVAESQAPCRPAAGSLQSCDASTLRTLIGVAASGDTLLTSLATVADQILVSTGASAWSAVTVGASTLLGKGAAGAVDDLTPSQARTVLGIDPATAGDVAVGTGIGTVGLVTIATNTVLGDDGGGVEALDATELLALIGVEAGADDVDAAAVSAAGAVMLSEMDGTLYAFPAAIWEDGAANSVAVSYPSVLNARNVTKFTSNTTTQDIAACGEVRLPDTTTGYASTAATMGYIISSGTATVTLQAYRRGTDTTQGSPCATSSAGSSGTWADVTISAATLAATCTDTAGTELLVCARFDGSTSGAVAYAGRAQIIVTH